MITCIEHGWHLLRKSNNCHRVYQGWCFVSNTFYIAHIIILVIHISHLKQNQYCHHSLWFILIIYTLNQFLNYIHIFAWVEKTIPINCSLEMNINQRLKIDDAYDYSDFALNNIQWVGGGLRAQLRTTHDMINPNLVLKISIWSKPWTLHQKIFSSQKRITHSLVEGK